MTKRTVTFDDSQPVGQRTPIPFRQDMDFRYGSGGATTAVAGKSLESFGVVGDGVTDDTTAFKSAVAWVQVGNRRVFAANYGARILITDPPLINTSAGNWSFDAPGAVIIQNTNGAPVFDFTVENVYDFKIDTGLSWTNQQTPTMGTAGIRFDNGGTNTAFLWYGALIRLRLFNAHDGVVTRDIAGHKLGLWNSKIEVKAGYGCTGTPVRLGSGTVGQTGLDIDVYCHRETTADPVIKLVVADAPMLRVKMDGENQSAANGIVLEACQAVLITGRQERGYLADGDAIISLTDCQGVGIDFSVQAIQGFTGSSQSVVKCLTGSYSGATGTSGVRINGAYSTYSPSLDAPATLHTAYVDDGSAALVVDGFVLQGSMTRATPASKQPATGGTAADNSIAPGKLVRGSTTPSSTTFYRGDGTWQTISGGGGSSSVAAPRRQSMGALGHSLMVAVTAYDSTAGVDTHLGAAGGHGPGDFPFLANAQEGCPIDILGSAATVGYTVQQIRDTWLPVILAMKPEYCIVWAPCANNILASGEIDAATLSIEVYVYEQLVAAGITPIMATLPPAANSSNAGFSQSEMIRYNAWAANYAQKKGYPFLDMYTAMVDYTTGAYRSGESTDNTHPGALAAARAVPIMRELIKKLAIRPNVVALPGYNVAATGRVTNPLLAGTLGANLPTGWTSSGVTINLAAAPSTGPTLGNILSVTANGSFGYVTAPVLAGSPGNEWDLAFRWGTTPVSGGGWGMYVYDQSGSNIKHAWGHSSLPNPTVLALEKPFHARGKFGSGVSQLMALIFVVGAGSQMQIAQFGFTNPSAMSVPMA